MLTEKKDFSNFESEKYPKEIKDVTSFDELYSVLDAMGGVIGSDGKKHTVERLKSIIETIRNAKDAFVPEEGVTVEILIQSITRGEGGENNLRKKVESLLEMEKENRK